MMKKIVLGSLIASVTAHAQIIPYMGAYGGYGMVEGAYQQDGDFAQGRLALGLHANAYHSVLFGGELGIQSGNTMRLDASTAIIDLAGGLPIQSTLKPLIDALFTVKGQFSSDSPFSYALKAGIAFRQLQLEDRTSSQDSLSKINAEFQAGLGYSITKHAVLTAFYQGIYSHSTAGIGLDSSGSITLSHIPTQQAGFLGIEYSF